MAKEENNKEEMSKTGEEQENSQEADVFENMPPEVKKVVEMGFSMQRISGAMPNPLLSMVTEKHIDTILGISQKEEENSFKDAQSSKKYNLIYFLVIILLIVFLIIFLIDKDKALLLSIIDRALFLLAGLGSGYGFKTYLDNKKGK